MKRFLADVDDVTAKFRQLYIDTYNRLFNVQIEMKHCMGNWDMDKTLNMDRYDSSLLWKEINKPGWNQEMQPMEGALEAIDRIARKYEVMFVTKPLKSSATWESDRRKWVRKHFGVTLSQNIHQTEKKYAVDGNFLVEDKLEHAQQWIADRMEHSRRECQAIMYAWPYNEHTKILRLPDWKSIAEYVGC